MENRPLLTDEIETIENRQPVAVEFTKEQKKLRFIKREKIKNGKWRNLLMEKIIIHYPLSIIHF